MSTTFTTFYLGLVIPVNLQDPTPQWGLDLYNALIALDQKLGTGANGIVVNSGNITINADLSFNNYNATNVRALRLQSLSAVPSLSGDIGEIVNVNGDGYWINNSGNAVRLTQGNTTALSALQYPTQLNISGSYTVTNPSSNTSWFAINTTSVAATFFLPAANQVNSGRTYILQDVNSNSETHNITITPSGTDNINGSNSSVIFAHNGGVLTITTDGINNWYTSYSSDQYTHKNSIQPLTLSTAGQNFTVSAGNSTGSTGGNLTLSAGTGTSNGSINISSVLNLNQGTTQNINLQGTKVFDITATSLNFGSLVSNPTIGQTTNTSAGNNLTLQAQAAGASNTAGGNLTLASGLHNGTAYDGYVYLQAGSTVEAFVSSTTATSAGGLGIGTTPGTDPTITRGTGVPSTTQPNGSLFIRTDATSASTALYTTSSGTWSPVSGLTAPVVQTTRTITTTYTVDSISPDGLVLLNNTSAFNLTLPTPTLGRTLTFTDIKGTAETNNITFVRHGSENINGVAASRVFRTNYGTINFVCFDGTNWLTY